MGTVIRLAQKIIGGDVEIVAEEAEPGQGGGFQALFHLADLIRTDPDNIRQNLLGNVGISSQFPETGRKFFLVKHRITPLTTTPKGDIIHLEVIIWIS